jgi:hypothetical protein
MVQSVTINGCRQVYTVVLANVSITFNNVIFFDGLYTGNLNRGKKTTTHQKLTLE